MTRPALSVLIRFYTTVFLDRAWMCIGRIFGAGMFGGKKAFRVADFDEILINRADRFGDAIISRPFLAVFARCVQAEAMRLGVTPPKIRVIASAYNVAFLQSLESEGIIVEVAAGVTSYNYDRSILYALQRLLVGYMSAFPRILSKKRSRIAFVDLVDSVTEWVEADFPGRMEAAWISSNRGPYSVFFDYTLPTRFSGSSKQNIIESYIDLFSSAFSLPSLRDMVYANMAEFYPGIIEQSDSTEVRPILCLVGVKEFRNFSIDLWYRIILALASRYPDRSIDIIDAPDNLVRVEFEKLEYPKNVRIIDNPHPPLADFAAWASHRYGLAFGVDGGGINALRPYMNVTVAYTLGNHHVWSAFTGSAPVQYISLGDGWMFASAEVCLGITQSWIYKNAHYLPSFQIPVGKECFDDLNEKKFVGVL